MTPASIACGVRQPRHTVHSLIDRDLHAHQLVEPPVEAGAPHRLLEPADRLGEVGPQREGTDDLGAVPVGKCDASHAPKGYRPTRMAPCQADEGQPGSGPVELRDPAERRSVHDRSSPTRCGSGPGPSAR